MWNQWTLFSSNKAYNTLLFEKQIGLISDSQSFSHRSKWQGPPGVINIFESILAGIDYRYKKGLYPNKHRYYLELQTALQECLRVYKDHRDSVIEAFQNKTLLTVTKEKEPKVVVTCEKCKSYALINVFCSICYNTFYCDQACMKANYIEHHKFCKESIETVPKVLETLQVEMHSCSWNENVTLYFEHETKFSLKGRGIRLFAELKNRLIQNKLVRAYNYSVKEYKNSLALVPEALSPLATPDRTEKVPSYIKAHSFTEVKDNGEGKANLDNSIIKQSAKKEETEKQTIEDKSKNAKLPIIQETKLILLEMGGIVADIIQERYSEKSSFVHIFLLPQNIFCISILTIYNKMVETPPEAQLEFFDGCACYESTEINSWLKSKRIVSTPIGFDSKRHPSAPYTLTLSQTVLAINLRKCVCLLCRSPQKSCRQHCRSYSFGAQELCKVQSISRTVRKRVLCHRRGKVWE
eukprot:TRINITY_DN2112_c0_g1_i3.p3 TRINITY_DN2112_c0_g1~~TRINITY_DN2112_c0_g1_i3.p3  ORF type:complete len:466 (+),score=23.55 TRINITY_DN2112_c0_g1_i3:1836-3233(+)